MNVARDEGIFSAALVDEIRDARKGRGWTQAQLAERTGGSVSKASLTGYEAGRRALRVPSRGYWPEHWTPTLPY